MLERKKTIKEVLDWLIADKSVVIKEIESESKTAIGRLESAKIEKELAREIYYYCGKNWELVVKIMSVIAPQGIMYKFSEDLKSEVTALTKEEEVAAKAAALRMQTEIDSMPIEDFPSIGL